MNTLNNIELAKEIKSGNLLFKTEKKMLEGASYQLRLGNVYYDLSEDGKRFELLEDQTVIIKPGHRVVLITLEEFSVPPNFVARIVSKGSLFSIGLSAVATYADPGFCGNLGIVTQNVSNKYLELSQGMPIAKVEFTQLSSEATKVYNGQHGFQSGIWPLKDHLQKSYCDIANDPRVLSEHEEALALLPEATRMIIKRLETTVLWTSLALVMAIGFIIFILYSITQQNSLLDYIWGIGGSLIATGLIAFGGLLVAYIRRTK